MGWVWGLKMRMVLEESQDLLNTQETGRSNGFPRPWKLLIYHRSPTLPDKMISFSITCKELKLSCRYWRMESFSFSYCLHHDVSALGLRLYMWVSPCWHGCNLPSLISFSPLGVLWEHHQAAGPLGQAGLGRGIEEMGWALGWGWTTSRSTGIRSRAFQSPWPQKTFLDVPPGDIMTILSSEELHCKTENCARSQREPADKDQMGWNRRQANWWGQGQQGSALKVTGVIDVRICHLVPPRSRIWCPATGSRVRRQLPLMSVFRVARDNALPGVPPFLREAHIQWLDHPGRDIMAWPFCCNTGNSTGRCSSQSFCHLGGVLGLQDLLFLLS